MTSINPTSISETSQVIDKLILLKNNRKQISGTY